MSAPGFFTHKSAHYRLPHPRIDPRLILVVHAAFVTAFEMLRVNPPSGFVLLSANEDSITRQLDDILSNRLLPSGSVPGFNSTFFRDVIRAPELTNVDGQHPAKKPDLVLRLNRENAPSIIPNQDGLFVECKPVQQSRAVGSHYCDLGIQRFINGDYAWAMREAMMVAYVRNRFTIRGNLQPALRAKTKQLGTLKQAKPVTGSKAVPHAEVLHYTTHRRSFVWPSTGRQATQLQLFHSWHDCE
jgi:hypothetical protein